ncbi:uncharacterized protein LOC128204956 [Mya arenaria]|uniref:uncharacterized protein LOC128204956 n=1 Tax=Mya arenaria TaxID=6604 RepID=UPI0022E59FCA|nr:uncharacterized protein LOC128204956 [Mya arenaria]
MSDDIPAKRRKIGTEEDPCSSKGRYYDEFEGLKNTIVRHYLSENTKLTLGPFFQKENPDLDDFYVPPTLSKVLPVRLATGYTSYKKEPITSLEQLLNPLGRRKRFTCITSNAGLGKTSFCKFLARLWCAVKKNDHHLLDAFKGKADYLQDVEYLRKFDYLFSVSIKDVESNNVNIDDIIFSHLQNKIDDSWVSENDKKKLQQDLREKHSLIILDGLDEKNMSKFTPPLESRNYTIICTSRPWKLGALGMSTSTYTEIQLEEMNLEIEKELECFEVLCEFQQDKDDLPTGFDKTKICNRIPSFVLSLGNFDAKFEDHGQNGLLALHRERPGASLPVNDVKEIYRPLKGHVHINIETTTKRLRNSLIKPSTERHRRLTWTFYPNNIGQSSIAPSPSPRPGRPHFRNSTSS